MPEFRALLSNDSEMAQRIRSFDWTATSFGPPAHWPQSLRSTLSICLNSSFPSAIYWGKDMRLIYNDAWSSIPGPRHPWALGRCAREVWSDIWHVIEPQLSAVFTTGRGFVTRDQMLPMKRFGVPEETYWDYSFTPIAGEDGSVAGVFNQGQETTPRVLMERRSRLMLALSDQLRQLETPGEVLSSALEIAGSYLDVERIFYGEVDREQQTLRIDACWAGGTLPPIAGTISLTTLGEDVHESLRHGEIAAVNDVRADPRLKPGAREQLAEMETEALLAAPNIRNGLCASVMVAQQAQPRHWHPGEVSMLRSISERTWQEVTRARNAMALGESERRHRLIFEQARDIIFTADLDQRLTACNPAAAEAIGLPAEQIVGRFISEFIEPDEFQKTSAMLQQKLQQGGMTRYEVSVNTAYGRVRKWDVNSALTINADGNPIGLHAVARDVTDQRAFEEQQKLLINELNHRVKNTLALVQGLAIQSFKQNRTVIEGQDIFQARLGMLAAGHDLLTREKWEGATVAALVADATAPYADPAGRISAEGSNVFLAPQAAISLGMALHELGTNAAKYGALSVPEGRVEIRWSRKQDGAFNFTWREFGGPAAHMPERQGFGLRMIERALASDLNGRVHVEFPAEGLICYISATLPEGQ